MWTAQPDLSDLFPCTSLRLVLVFKHGFEIQLAYFFRIAGLIEWLSHILNKYPLSRKLDYVAFSAEVEVIYYE